MKIEIIGESCKLTTPDGGLLVLSRGDQITVDDEVGMRAVARGWASDLDGQIQTGERVPGASAAVVPDRVKQTG